MDYFGRSIILGLAEIGVQIEKLDEREDAVRIFISVPEHSEERNDDGVEMAGNVLARALRRKMKAFIRKELVLFCRIRKDDSWTKRKGILAEEEMKKKLSQEEL